MQCISERRQQPGLLQPSASPSPAFLRIDHTRCANDGDASTLGVGRHMKLLECHARCFQDARCTAYTWGGANWGWMPSLDAAAECQTFRHGCVEQTDDSHHLWVRVDLPGLEECNCRLQRPLGARNRLQMYAAWEQQTGQRAVEVDRLKTNTWAMFHYLQELPAYMRLFNTSAELHPYWSLAGFPVQDMTFNELLTARSMRMWQQWPDRDDFTVEKSKCVMNRYFARAGLPHPQVLQHWDDPEAFLLALEAVDSEAFPFMIKFCHLTQGSQGKNTHYVRDRETLAQDRGQIAEWVMRSWNLTSKDYGRPWGSFGLNAVLPHMPKGVFIQKAWPVFAGLTEIPLEIKVDCFWGRCYVCRFENNSMYPFHNPEREWIRLAMGFRDGRIESGDVDTDLFDLHKLGLSRIPELDVHLKAAFALAEKDMQILKMDFLRVDIFLNPNDPSRPVINEHSLFEVDLGGSHHRYFELLWKLGYTRGRGVLRELEYVPSYTMSDNQNRDDESMHIE
eukprot:TRINITY_DN29791_c0_g1_i2.p1 TRINITY_DN29791_c0_g1~~TRINITY_DN29791_c0_g1_i2.p1  ORF type:complete len:506 (+),score=84.35 TRINITY_DN29791_c0_g1_i2:1-1518(+)